MEIKVVSVQFMGRDGKFQNKSYHYFLHKGSSGLNPGDTFTKSGFDKFGNKKYDTLRVNGIIRVSNWDKLPDEIQKYINKVLLIKNNDKSFLYAEEMEMKPEWWNIVYQGSKKSKQTVKESKPESEYVKRFLKENPWWEEMINDIIERNPGVFRDE